MTKQFDKDKLDKLFYNEKAIDIVSYIIIAFGALFVLATLIRFIFF